MVLHKHGERLYSGLKEVVTNHLESKVGMIPLIVANINLESLHSLVRCWMWM